MKNIILISTLFFGIRLYAGSFEERRNELVAGARCLSFLSDAGLKPADFEGLPAVKVRDNEGLMREFKADLIPFNLNVAGGEAFIFLKKEEKVVYLEKKVIMADGRSCGSTSSASNPVFMIDVNTGPAACIRYVSELATEYVVKEENLARFNKLVPQNANPVAPSTHEKQPSQTTVSAGACPEKENIPYGVSKVFPALGEECKENNFAFPNQRLNAVTISLLKNRLIGKTGFNSSLENCAQLENLNKDVLQEINIVLGKAGKPAKPPTKSRPTT